MRDKLYHYKAKVLRVIDGDTIVLEWIDLGFNMRYMNVHARLLGIDTAELRSKDETEKALAYEAKSFVEDKLGTSEVIIQSKKIDSFGRILADIWLGEENIGEVLISRNLALPFMEQN